MAKILDLRKKAVQVSQAPSQKPGEGIKFEKRDVRTLKQPEPSQTWPEPVATQKRAEERPHISWEAPSFYYNPQKRYLSLLVAALLAGAVALLMFGRDALTSIFLILSSLVLLLYSNQKPTVSKITINQSGIWVDDKVYYYKDLKSFWIEYNPGGTKELSIESAKWYLPYIKILLNNQNPIEVRSLVINFLPEKEHENSLIDHIGRRLGL